MFSDRNAIIIRSVLLFHYFILSNETANNIKEMKEISGSGPYYGPFLNRDA